MSKLYFRKIETCSTCPFIYINNLDDFSKRCTLEGKQIETEDIPSWCKLVNYEEKIEVNETERVWVKIK